MRRTNSLTLVCAMVVSTLLLKSSSAAPILIGSSSIISLSGSEIGSGNGTLDFILFSSSNGGATNSSGAFNGDDANTAFPTGGVTTANESFITSIGDLREFYRFNFPDGNGGSTVNQIVVFVDVNETGGAQAISLNELNIVQDFATSATATLNTGVGDFRDFRDISGHTEVSHEQEVYRPAVG